MEYKIKVSLMYKKMFKLSIPFILKNCEEQYKREKYIIIINEKNFYYSLLAIMCRIANRL